MGKIRTLVTKFAQKTDLPVQIAASLPCIELHGFSECSLDCHKGILVYEKDRIVVSLNIGSAAILGSDLEIRYMHRDRLTVCGSIHEIVFSGGSV